MFPDDRLTYSLLGPYFAWVPAGTVVAVFTDAGGTIPADVLHEDGSPVTVGAPLVVDSYSEVPLFQGPNDASDTLYVVVSGAPPAKVFARVDDRLDAVESRVGVLESTLSGGGFALATRNINTTAPVLGGGNLSADRTLSLDFTHARLRRLVQCKLVDDATALTTFSNRVMFVVPPELNGLAIVDADAYVVTASSSGLPTVQIHKIGGPSILSTAITIDITEKTSYTAATAPVINGANATLATGDLLAADVTTAGTSTTGLGIALAVQ